jgi:hypothetical protein
MVARCQLLDPKCRLARARKNYWRLYARYPEIAKIAARLGLTPSSVYDPLYRVVAAGAAAQQERVQSLLRLWRLPVHGFRFSHVHSIPSARFCAVERLVRGG